MAKYRNVSGKGMYSGKMKNASKDRVMKDKGGKMADNPEGRFIPMAGPFKKGC